MEWTPLPEGCFTGIDWAQPKATDGFDPYLIWAETARFAGYGNQVPQWLPVAVELNANASIAQFIGAASPEWLQVPPVYSSGAAPTGLRFCTARVKPAFFDAIQVGGPLHAVVKRLELGLPVQSQAGDAKTYSAPPAPSLRQELLEGKVLGLIDDSLAVAQTNFLGTGATPRTAFLWRQDGQGKGSTPEGLAYGHELTAADIDTAMKRHTHNGLVDESAVYVALGLSTLGRKWADGRVEFHALDTSASHGTHVADLAGGPRTPQAQVANLPPGFDAPPSWASAEDDASRCRIVAVQLDYNTVKDTSGGSMNVHLLDGLMYILSRCAPTAKIAVNISFGTLAGPHDGTSLLESAMQQLLTLLPNRLCIVLAAGNSYQLRTHANVTLARKQEQTLHWRVQPDDDTQSFLELWIEEGREGVEIEITPPGRQSLPALPVGQSRMWLDAGNAPVCALIYPRRVASGERGTCALLSLAPTFSFEPSTTTAPSGVWLIRLRNTGTELVTIDAYVERDDTVVGSRSGARQSHFEDSPALAPDQQYDMQAYVDDPNRSTPIRRSGNFNTIATGSLAVSVGGRRMIDDSWAHYSPRRPDPDDARPERPGVVKMPQESAYSDESAALVGLKAAGTRSGGVARLAGTSDAAPQVTRKRLNAM